MASPSGTSSGSSSLQSCEENLQPDMMEIKKRKRMLSNRESARRSRMRKQKHLDDLTEQLGHLRAENNHILTNINLVTELYLNTESENSVFRAQMSELNHRLLALNDIINCVRSKEISTATGFQNVEGYGDYDDQMMMISELDDDLLNPCNLIHVYQPITASPDVFMC